MKITVVTGDWAARYLNERSMALKMPERSTVADVIKAAGIPEDEAGIAVISGKAVPREYPLSDGETVKIHPIIIGG